MSFISKNLQAGEKVIYQAPVSKLAYIWVIINFLLSFMPIGLLKIAGTELALTNKRLLGRSGTATIRLAHSDIAYVGIRHGVAGAILGFGTVIVYGKNGQEVKFKNIVWPSIFQQEVNEAIEIAILGGKLSEYGLSSSSGSGLGQ